MNWDQLQATLYTAIEAIKRGDVDDMQIQRTWEDDDIAESCVIVISRNVMARTAVEKFDENLQRQLEK